jgi:predicted unusual protein kinase regulating ubiquinone biosynthesis (AarF/ABC1/UbiB family)
VAVLYAPRRLVAVVWQFLPLVWTYARDRRRFLLFGRPRRVDAEGERRRARKLLDVLLSLGPTFIKLGQLLSTRPDILPPAYIDVLAELQDRVPPAAWPEARTVIEGDVGDPDDLFEEFDTEAISGASLGQVYTAVHDGRKVAVKVRRPDVADLVDADLRVIKRLLPVILFFVDDARSFSLQNLADEFAKTIREEMDYAREREMLLEIRENFADDDRVAVPAVVDEASGDRVLTMEYVDGTKVTDLEGLAALDVDRSELAETMERAYLKMIIEDGVFHADPHPGNLSVQDDGTLVFYDFGMSGRVDDSISRALVEFYLSVAERDIDGIIDVLQRMGTLSTDVDRSLMAEVLELAIKDARGEAVEQYRVQRIVRQVENTIYEFPFRLPRDLALLLRVATVVEGVCVQLDPEFDFIDVATDYLAERGYREEGVRQALDAGRQTVQDAAVSAVRVPPKFERTLDTIERGNLRVEAAITDPEGHLARLSRRLSYAVLLAASGLATALLYVNADPRLAVPAGVATAVFTVLLYRAMRTPSRLAPEPQFTRQGMRDQQGGGMGLDIGDDD